MTESLKRHYLREEEFLDEFYGVASVAASHLNDDWRPLPSCNDTIRKNTKYFLGTGELNQLVFDSASVYHDGKGFSSAQIVLRSSKRIVNVHVKKIGEVYCKDDYR